MVRIFRFFAPDVQHLGIFVCIFALLHSETVITEEMFSNAGPFDLYLWYLTGTTDHMKK